MDYEELKYIYLANLIKNGCYKNGRPFQPVDFFKYVSGYTNGEDLMLFINNKLCRYFSVSNEAYGIITKFMLDNKFARVYFMPREWAYDNPMSIFGVRVTKEMIDTVFDYMEANGYPNINIVYYYFFKRYATKKLIINKKLLGPKQNIVKFVLRNN